jgi:hypothetical protein
MLSFFKLNKISLDRLFIISKTPIKIAVPKIFIDVPNVIVLHSKDIVDSDTKSWLFDSFESTLCWNISDRQTTGKNAMLNNVSSTISAIRIVFQLIFYFFSMLIV